MSAEELSSLLEMGFVENRAQLALKKTGGLTAALEWLEKNQDKAWEEIEAEQAEDNPETNPNIESAALKPGEVAKSMVCKDCGKKLRSMNQVQFHAEKSGHENFEESAEEIAPLTEEEKKARLEELRGALAEKRAKQALVDKEEAKKNEKIRMKSTKEVAIIKEDLEKKERLKEAAAKRQEKLNDIAAKKRIQEKIAADKEERRLKAEKAKAEREGRAPPAEVAPVAAAPSASRPATTHTEARLRLQTAAGVLTKTYPADTTLFEVAQAIQGEIGSPVTSFTMNYPKKEFSGSVDFGKTVKEAGLVPSAVLIVK